MRRYLAVGMVKDSAAMVLSIDRRIIGSGMY